MTSSTTRKLLAAGFAGALALGTAGAVQAQQGVSDTEVVIGSNGDLSGIFAPFNVQAIQAAQMEFDKVNEAGGIHGRTIRFVVEDHTYQVPKAVANFNKLINSDRVFAMILNLGTPHNIAGFQMMEPKKVANISPLSAGRQMIEGDTTYKYTGTSSYYEQLFVAMDYLSKNQDGAEEVCAMYIPSDYGNEVAEGAKDGAEAAGMTFASETTHKPDEQDFAGSLSKLREAGCDIIATGLGLRQTIVAMGTAKKLGWNDVSFVGGSAAMNTVVAKVPGGVTEGFYAGAGWSDLEARMADTPELQEWAAAFKARFDSDPGTAAQLGYGAAITLIRALEAAGTDLTPESFQAGMESLEFYDPIMDIDVKYGPGDHKGADLIYINRVIDGVWKEVARQ